MEHRRALELRSGRRRLRDASDPLRSGAETAETAGAEGGSTGERAPRHRVGAMIEHKLLGYRGVVVGWDR